MFPPELSTGQMPEIVDFMRKNAPQRFAAPGRSRSVQLPRCYRVFAHTVPR